MLDASEFSGSNYFTGENIPPNIRIEFTVTSAFIEEFKGKNDDGERKVVLGTDYQAKKLIMNKTRNKTAIRAWGPNAHNWVGKPAAVFRDTTVYAGKLVPCVGFEPIVTNTIAPPERKTIEAPKPISEINPPSHADYDGADSDESDDRIPF
jgi:hypothetical protein